MLKKDVMGGAWGQRRGPEGRAAGNRVRGANVGVAKSFSGRHSVRAGQLFGRFRRGRAVEGSVQDAGPGLAVHRDARNRGVNSPDGVGATPAVAEGAREVAERALGGGATLHGRLPGCGASGEARLQARILG
jgi:hypothetical protein